MDVREIACLLIGFAVLMTGALELTYQVYRIVVLDALSRGLKKPRLWGLLAIGGNNSSGMICYLIGRRKHPVIDLPQERRTEMERRKKRALAGLFFIAAGSIGMVVTVLMLVG